MGDSTDPGATNAPGATNEPSATPGSTETPARTEPVAAEPVPAEPVAAESVPPAPVEPTAATSVPPAPSVPVPVVATSEPLSPPIAPAPATATAVPPSTGNGRGRSALMVFLYLLTCLSLVVSVVLVWSHQVALNTDRYVTVISRVADDPAVVAGAADRIATQIVVATDLEARLGDRLPGPTKSLAPLITDTIQDSLATRIDRGLSSEQFQDIWVSANRIAHQAIVKLLRGQSDVVTTQDGYVTINLLPIVQKLLVQLQTSGIIPADVTIPDLSDPATVQASLTRLEGVLGRPLPDDFGQVRLVEATRLEQAKTLVTIFDIVVVASVLLSIALVAITIFLARRRLRMAIALAIGALVSWGVAIWAVGALQGAVVSAIATGDGTLGRAIIRDLVSDLTTWLFWLAIAAAVTGVVLYLASRPAWLFRRGGETPPA